MANAVSLNLPKRFQAAFEEASRTTGTDFEYLLSTAKRESNFNSSAKASTSSATGLFQFVEQTWLETMKESGAELGYGNAASQITKVGDKYYVKDQQAREQILDMRNDPKVSAVMAGAYAQRNKEQLAEELNRTPSQGELYAAHFLGAQGSSKLITLAENSPKTEAAEIFPAQAQANRNIFYDKQGNSKTVAEVYSDLVSTASSSTTTKEEKTTLFKVFGLGNLFSPKESMKSVQLTRAQDSSSVDSVTQQAQTEASAQSDAPSVISESKESLEAFFNEPLQQTLPSRYGLAYSSTDTTAVGNRVSRLVAGDDGQTSLQVATEGSRSRIFSDAYEASETSAVSSENTLSVLPRRKPVTAEVYVNELNGVLPKAKPETISGANSGSASSSTSSPLDLTGEQVTAAVKATKRFGALDLSAFLKADVFSSSKKG
ncbi:transglycosylase SLT domain-containing protein [uncultured Cohaesibacter sp.]|uniref:transglycosylase SLT domain-containing protein n=1 Tax=uncultured Cohaesibacter sp. TaxID=1002546 RepID=UPI00292F1E17|nr:transglycosylase SLT domain-containing protein [uncultured Cohaesibacter sp.]